MVGKEARPPGQREHGLVSQLWSQGRMSYKEWGLLPWLTCVLREGRGWDVQSGHALGEGSGLLGGHAGKDSNRGVWRLL